mmetsp:Transcript_45729/g.109045  ORF Transcript_45729/g.109045 Transcript_45729/m.109045 type:complete len:667 (-) Transcript_45729:67-2067(-)
MGCCESRQGASLGAASQNQALYSSSIDESAGGPFAAVQRAAEAIRVSASGVPPPGGLRDVRLTLLALPRDAASVPEVHQQDVEAVVSALNQQAESADVMLTGLVLMRYLAQRQANQQKMAGASAVSLVLRAVHLHDANPTLQGVACDTLGNLLQEPSNSQQFVQLRGVEAVLRVINSNMAHTRVMEAACFLLGNVASTEEGLANIAANQGAAVAMQVLRAQGPKDSELLRELLFLVTNMAQAPKLRAELAASGAVEAVLTIMKDHTGGPDVQAMGCSALDNLCTPPDATDPTAPPPAKPTFPPEAPIQAVLAALKMHRGEPSVVRRASSAVATMAAIRPPLRALDEDGLEAVEAVAAAGRAITDARHDPHALAQVFRAMEALASHRRNRTAIMAEGGALSLVGAVVRHSSPRPATVARGLDLVAKMCELADGDPEGGYHVPEGEGLALVGAALGQLWNHPAVVIPACTVLASLAKDGRAPRETQDEEVQAGWRKAMMGLIRALRARPGDVAVAVSASVAIAWTCERKVTPAIAEVGDLMSAFVMVMRAHARDADVAEAACFMFSAVARDSTPEIRAQVIKSGAPLLVVMLLRQFADAPGDMQPVLRRGVNAIRLIGLEDPATAGAVRLAGAPEALNKILKRYPESESLVASATAALQRINGSGDGP